MSPDFWRDDEFPDEFPEEADVPEGVEGEEEEYDDGEE